QYCGRCQSCRLCSSASSLLIFVGVRVMGITIHFRGTIDAMDRIEEFEDRVLDVAFALGGRGSLWRSYADHDPQRIVRGLLVELSPGQETTSLLLSPEGQLMGFMQIEE